MSATHTEQSAKMNHHLYTEIPTHLGNQRHNTAPKYSFIFCFKQLNSPVLTDFFSLIEE